MLFDILAWTNVGTKTHRQTDSSLKVVFLFYGVQTLYALEFRYKCTYYFFLLRTSVLAIDGTEFFRSFLLKYILSAS